MKKLKFSLSALILVLLVASAKSQSLPVGTPVLEDYYRRAQLLGQIDSNVSFTVRPINPASAFKVKNAFYPDSAEKGFNRFNPQTTTYFKKGFATILPVSLQTQFNSDHPYGWNDGAMIPSKGLQTLLSAGVYAQYGPLSIQLRPEFVVAANSNYDDFNKNHYEVIVAKYYDFYNNIDLPSRFGTGTYVKPFWGQSSIRLNYSSFSFGLSTENLWWGPGIRNSLIMSNDAPGFKHLTLNTTKPVKTPIGSFEGQLIAGRLENSGYPPLTPTRTFFSNPLYVPKPDDWRYLSGIVLTWQPKWVPGLFLGMTKTSQLYGKDLNKFGDYLPFFSEIKSNTGDQPINQPDQRSSIFARWVWQPEHAELYFEWGNNNNNTDLRDAALNPESARAYTFGIRKLLTLRKEKDEYIMVNVEATQLQETSIDADLNAESWYVNHYIRQGYTNQGQILGAGIGPGGNLQSLDVSWVRGLKRIGLQIERYLHNNDFYYDAFADSQDFRRHWVDLSVALNGEWNYKNFIFNAKLMGVKSLNYQWYLLQNPGDPYFVNGKEVFNLQIQAGLTYRF